VQEAKSGDYARAVGTALRERKAERGIIFCGSGAGVSMAATPASRERDAICAGPPR
jgi:ribose 5-phosphate isomerase RpiB